MYILQRIKTVNKISWNKGINNFYSNYVPRAKYNLKP